MTTITGLKFDSADGADKMLDLVQGLTKQQLITLQDAAIVTWPDGKRKPQTKHLGKPVVWATTEVGDVNQFVHVWAYGDVAERAEKRAAMWADPDWIAYTKKVAEMGALVKQENRILIAAPFSL